ncbi:hypothetical protein Gohar_006912 [Gossypium harknessii]|uniref:Uncharacterized protein n=1 Tax=Gossypium harknessii TaxID=34285 RepID=A0A7J9GG91_9ROSI|nr:hypothetical protein [Gossypium harknessii]
MDCRRNCKDDLKGIWQSWDEAKKTRFRDKDAMGKVSSDKQLALFVLVVYGLIVLQKALRYEEEETGVS